MSPFSDKMLFTSPRLLPVRRCAIHDQEIVIELRHHAGVAQLRNGGGDGRGEARARMDRTTLLFHCATRPRCPSTAARPRRLFETVVLVMHNRFEPRHPRWMKMACRRRVGVAALACPLLMGSTCLPQSPPYSTGYPCRQATNLRLERCPWRRRRMCELACRS